MKTEIRTHLSDPKQLEKLYRTNRASFKQSFNALYPTLQGNVIADYWNERLNYESDALNWGEGKELLFVVAACAVAGLIAKLPAFFSIDEEFFYSRNIGFIVFPLLTLYFAWKNRLAARKIALLLGATVIGLTFVNLLPNVPESDTIVLSCLHLILVLWSILGLAFVGHARNKGDQRIAFLSYNGDLLVMMALIVIAGAALSGITVGLFAVIGFDIGEFYFQYIGIVGLSAIPMAGTYLIQTNPQLVGKISPLIARIFSPLVLVMLVTYLSAMVYGGKDPYNDREFLLIFNVLLIGVIAIIFFSIAGTTNTTKSQIGLWVLFLLATLTIIVNTIALSAIMFRISEWGITPNRAAVLGANVLVLMNLILVLVQFIRVLRGHVPITRVQVVVARYLPIYCLWALIVTFLFPMIFGI